MSDIVSQKPHLFLGSRLKRLAEQMQSDVGVVAQRAGIPIQPGQYQLLATLDVEGPMTIGALAKAMRLSQPAITKNTGRLLNAGFVALDQSSADMRQKVVSLTAAGKQALARSKRLVWPQVESAVREVTDGLSGPLLDQITTIEQRLAERSLSSRAASNVSNDLVPARDADVPPVVALMNLAYRGSGAAAGWTTEGGYIEGDRTTEALLRQDLAEKPEAVLLIWRQRAEESLRGCVWLEPLGGDVWYLGSLTVDPRIQNAGHGRQLLYASEEWVRERGGTAITMTVVNVRDELLAWYERRGYRRTGETEPFPYEDNRFGVPKRDDLHFVVLQKRLA